MTSQTDDLDEEDEALLDEFDRHGMALHQRVQDYADEHDLSDEMTSLLLLNISVRMRMVGYALETEKPSASGLKLDLDRFRREIDDCLRVAKKGADHFIAEAKVARAAAERELEDRHKSRKSLFSCRGTSFTVTPVRSPGGSTAPGRSRLSLQ